MSDDSDVMIYRLSEARVMKTRDGRDLVILAIRSGAETTHYGMSLDDLGNLAERLRLDALMLKAMADPSGAKN